MILSAQERSDDQSKMKTRNERRMEPAFDICVELTRTNQWRVHQNIGKAVDVVLRQLGESVHVQVREMDQDGTLKISLDSFPEKLEREILSHLPSADTIE